MRSHGVVRQGKLRAAKRKPNVRSALEAVWFFSLFFMVPSCKPSDFGPDELEEFLKEHKILP